MGQGGKHEPIWMGLVTGTDGASVPAGTYTHVRVTLANAVYKVRATAHTYLDVAGELETDMALSNYQPAGGAARSAGQYQATFSAYGQSQSFSGSTTLNCTLSLWGGKVVTAGGRFQVTVPVPGGPLVVPQSPPSPIDVELVFPVQDQFAWRDLGEAKFAAGVYDVGMPPAPTEIPDSLFECQMFLADRCQGDVVVALQPSWPMPDSRPLFCTDGAQVVSPCPGEGEPGFGQDSNYLVHPLDYSAANGVVEDRVTGLFWQREAPAESFDWWEARDYCAGLELGGHGDWRLPTLKELQTLVDERRLQPSIDIFAFPDTPAEWFWSGTPIATHPDQAWATSYTDGYASIHAGAELHRVRCVHD